MRTAIEESVRDLAAQEESASKEAEALAAQSRDVLATVEAQTKEKVAATARLAALVADRNATEARIAGSAADLAALTRDLGVAQGELQVATQALSNRDHDLAQLVDAAEAPLGPLGRDVSELRASRARLLARADELRATLAESVKQRDSLAINVSALGRAVSAAELDLKASLASAELAEKAYDDLVRAARASEAKLATVSAERRRLEAQLHEQEVRRVAGGEAGDSEWAVHPTFPLHRQTDLSQLTSRADELSAATATLTKRRDALAMQSAELAPRLSAMHLRLDGVHREIAGLAPLVASLQKTVDQRAATLSFLSSSRAAVDNVTIGLLIAAASARRDAYAIGQEVHALRHPAEEAALDQAAALAAAGASSADGPLLPLSDAQLLAARDASVLSLVGGDIARARKRRGPSERLFRFRALAEPAMTDEVDADPENTGATTVPPTAASATLRRGGPSGEGMRHVAAERDLRLTRQALDHAVEEGRRWLEDKRSVARSVLELKARMDDLSARVGRLRDASERGATALEDARDASEELAFQVALTTQEANSTSEANAAAEKEAAFLAAKRADVARKLEDVQQLRVTRVVDLRAAIRAKLDARRAAAAALGNLQRERLDLAQAVSGATERARLLESDVETSAAQLAGLQRRAAMLTQSQDVVTGELRAADARRLAAIEGAAPLAQRRKDLEDAAVAEAATRGRLQALVASGSAAVAAAQANLEHLTASRRAVASSLSTLQLKLGAAEEELSNTGAASLEAGLELDRLALRRKALDSEAVRLARQIEDARVSLARAEARQARASGNLSGLHERVKHFSAVRARILSNSAKVNASESSSPLPEATGRGAARGTVQ